MEETKKQIRRRREKRDYISSTFPLNTRISMQLHKDMEAFLETCPSMTVSQLMRASLSSYIYDKMVAPAGEGTVPLTAMEEISRFANVGDPRHPDGNQTKLLLTRHAYADRLRNCNAIAERYVGPKPTPNFRRSFKITVFEGALRIIVDGAIYNANLFEDNCFVWDNDGDGLVFNFNEPSLGEWSCLSVAQTGFNAQIVIPPLNRESGLHYDLPSVNVEYEAVGNGFRIEKKELSRVGVYVEKFFKRDEF